MEPARSRPPLDPTEAPSVARIPLRNVPASAPVAVRRPVLASECLKDDAAPLEPHAVAFRGAIAVLGLACVCAAALGGPFYVFALAGAALAAAMVIRDYELRARVALGAAVVAVGAGIFGLATRGGVAPLLALRIVAPIALATVLFTRATYRAHRMTRIALGAALLLFLVAAASAGGAWGLPGLPRLAAVAMSVVALLSLLGFMSDQTTGGCAAWSALALATGLTSVALDRTELSWILPAAFVAAAACAAAIAAFQVAALRIAPAERRRDTRGSSVPTPPMEEG